MSLGYPSRSLIPRLCGSSSSQVGNGVWYGITSGVITLGLSFAEATRAQSSAFPINWDLRLRGSRTIGSVHPNFRATRKAEARYILGSYCRYCEAQHVATAPHSRCDALLAACLLAVELRWLPLVHGGVDALRDVGLGLGNVALGRPLPAALFLWDGCHITGLRKLPGCGDRCRTVDSVRDEVGPRLLGPLPAEPDWLARLQVDHRRVLLFRPRWIQVRINWLERRLKGVLQCGMRSGYRSITAVGWDTRTNRSPFIFLHRAEIITQGVIYSADVRPG